MSSKHIEMTVAADGAVTIQTVGFAGSTCQLADKFLRDVLGVVASEALSPEYHLPVTESQDATESQNGGTF